MIGDFMSGSTSGNAWGSIWGVQCEGDMRFGTGGLVGIQAPGAGTWSHGFVCAAAVCTWSSGHVGTCVVVLVGARTSAWAHTL